MLAIAITLLVIELRPPEIEHGESLASALWDLWPSYLAYLVAFAQLGVIWLNHHRIFEQVRVVDGPLLLLNLLLLLWVVVIPFPTAVVADFLRDGGEPARTAVVVFSGVLFLTAVSFTLLFAWVTHDDRLVGELPPREVVRASRIRFGIGLAAYAAAVGLAFLAPPLALAFHLAMAVYYAFDQASVTTSALESPA